MRQIILFGLLTQAALPHLILDQATYYGSVAANGISEGLQSLASFASPTEASAADITLMTPGDSGGSRPDFFSNAPAGPDLMQLAGLAAPQILSGMVNNFLGTGQETLYGEIPIGGPAVGLGEQAFVIGSTGKIGEDALKTLGGESQAYFSTSQGGRYIDQLVEGAANESKVGYQSLTSVNQAQIAKDAELLQAGRVDSVTWHFFTSPVTGQGGPSAPLLKALQDAGFGVVIR